MFSVGVTVAPILHVKWSFLHFKNSLVAYLVKFVVTNILIELEALEIAIHLNLRAAVNLANISSKIAATHEYKYEAVFIELDQNNKKNLSLKVL